MRVFLVCLLLAAGCSRGSAPSEPVSPTVGASTAGCVRIVAPLVKVDAPRLRLALALSQECSAASYKDRASVVARRVVEDLR